MSLLNARSYKQFMPHKSQLSSFGEASPSAKRYDSTKRSLIATGDLSFSQFKSGADSTFEATQDYLYTDQNVRRRNSVADKKLKIRVIELKLPQVQSRADTIQSAGDRQLTHDYSQSEIQFGFHKNGKVPESPHLRRKQRKIIIESVSASPNIIRSSQNQAEKVQKRAKIIKLSLSET